ncbi:MAG: beta-ketoacyl synthase N-terminal-like domain-containing protein, partial [Bacteroidota bacterium]
PKEAMLMDPQHRIFLECAYAALEDAGYDSENYEGTIGVFGGVARNTYLVNNVLTHPNFFQSLDDFQQGIALEKDFPATRVAYQLNLKGPAVNVQTACSSSGVAVHLACQSLLAGDCDLVIVGGGRIQPPLRAGHWHKEGHALSPDGYCRTFDAQAQGMVRGNGMAFIVLRRLEDAQAAGDQIRAVIKGTAVNNDGTHKIGFTAPSIQGQAKAIEKAYRNAQVDPATVDYIECHGTGTALGDPIELAGLTQAFARFTDRRGFCAVGSIKTNIGHLDAGACVAGIIKTVLSLEQEYLPASLHFKQPNPQIDFSASPFFVNDQLRAWPRGGKVRRAGVSSFGLGGTNVHVVLEEAPQVAVRSTVRQQHLLLWSAKTAAALERSLTQMSHFLEMHPNLNLTDLSATLQLGRRELPYRAAIVASDLEQLKTRLSIDQLGSIRMQSVHTPIKKLVFLFPGGGAQHSNMGLGLYREYATFREVVDECLHLLQTQHGLDLRAILYPDHDRSEPILNPLHAITLLFTVEYATARLLMDWGLEPSELIGHSLGEYTAACLAGVFSLPDALALVTLRGRLFQTLEEGAMLSIPLAPEAVQPLMDEALSFAAINKPEHCVVSGSVVAIDRIKAKLTAAKIHATRLHIKVAAHSHMIEPILDRFGALLEEMTLGAPQIPMISNLSGTWVDASTVQTVQYWKDHLRQTVRFSDGIATVLQLSDRVLIEAGPGQTLSTFARQHPAKAKGQTILAALRHPKEPQADAAFLLKTIGELWMEGVSVDWQAFNRTHAFRRMALPTYPFEKTSYWLDAKPAHVSTEDMPINTMTMDNQNGQAKAVNLPKMDRKTLLVQKVKALFQDLSGIASEELQEQASFLELGFDSLFLTQATAKLKQTFKIKLSFRQLFEEAPNIQALASYIDQQLAPEVFQAELDQLHQSAISAVAQQPMESFAPSSVSSSPSNLDQSLPPNIPTEQMGNMEQLFHRQLQIMEQQLALLRRGGMPIDHSTKPQNGKEQLQANPKQAASANGLAQPTTPVVKSVHPSPQNGAFKRGEGMAFGPWKPIDKRSREDLSEKELRYLDQLIQQYTTRTRGSQALTQAQRLHLADPRSITGFNRIWKDMVYQIAVERSKGAKVWDVDGNEYIDYRMAFGISLFGHTP